MNYKLAPAPKTPPVANAGTDKWVETPADNALLEGSGFDADGYIVTYNWSKLSGPSSLFIENPNAASTNVTHLVEGKEN